MGIVAAVADELAVVSLVEEVAGFLPSFDVGFEDKAVFIKLDGPTRRRTEDRRTVPQDMGQPLDDASAGSQHDSRGIGQLDQWFTGELPLVIKDDSQVTRLALGRGPHDGTIPDPGMTAS